MRSRLALPKLVLCLMFAPWQAMATPCDLLATKVAQENTTEAQLRQTNAVILRRLSEIPLTEIPSVQEISLANFPPSPGAMRRSRDGSPGIIDPLLERARVLNAVPDFKPLSDAFLKPLTPGEKSAADLASRQEADRFIQQNPQPSALERAIAWERHYTAKLIEKLYDLGGEVLSAGDQMPAATIRTLAPPRHAATLIYVENLWRQLFKKAPAQPSGSILETPYPFLIPAGRFKEGYYWDLYPAVRAMLATGRLQIAQMQVENLLHMVWRFGFVPNGWRDYYLSRSQPPFLSSMVREVYEATAASGNRTQADNWLRRRALPLLQQEYRFWMEGERWDESTGLNFHWDDINGPRPERFGLDNELALGETYRDTRAAAESGRDFTAAWNRRATHIVGPLLNAMLFKTEGDLAYLSRLMGAQGDADQFTGAADRRRVAMDRYLWNERLGAYVNFDRTTRQQIEILGADTAYPLFAGVPSAQRAERVAAALQTLEREGGLMSSVLVDSTHQWDGHHGWAPDQLVAVDGLIRYGMGAQGRRLAQKWTDTLQMIHDRHGNLPESVDVALRDRPKVDGTKYPVQEGFLWTNSTYILFLQLLHGRQTHH